MSLQLIVMWVHRNGIRSFEERGDTAFTVSARQIIWPQENGILLVTTGAAAPFPIKRAEIFISSQPVSYNQNGAKNFVRW